MNSNILHKVFQKRTVPTLFLSDGLSSNFKDARCKIKIWEILMSQKQFAEVSLSL